MIFRQRLVVAKQGPSKVLSNELSATISSNHVGPSKNHDNRLKETIEEFDSSDDSNNESPRNHDGEEKQSKEPKEPIILITTSASPEKRPYRSLIDCLEESYNENPPKIKRASESLPVEKKPPPQKSSEHIITNVSSTVQKVIESQTEDETVIKQHNKSPQMVDETKASQRTCERKEPESDETLNNSEGHTRNDAGEEDETSKIATKCGENDMKQESTPKSSPVTPKDQGQKKIRDFFKVRPT